MKQSVKKKQNVSKFASLCLYKKFVLSAVTVQDEESMVLLIKDMQMVKDNDIWNASVAIFFIIAIRLNNSKKLVNYNDNPF